MRKWTNRREIGKKILYFKEFIISSSRHGDSEEIKEVDSLPHMPKRYRRVASKTQEVGTFFRINSTINDIFPKANGISLIRDTNSNPSEKGIKPKNIFPPKRPFLSSKMRNRISIVPLPDEGNPLDISLPIKFV
jgi:hypothetical protein